MLAGKEFKRKARQPAGIFAVATVAMAIAASQALAQQEPIVFPAQGQSADKMEQDKYSCYQWAKGQTGFDPMQVPTATSPPPQQKGGALRGAAGGAAMGAAVGAIAGDAGKGAAIGAASGGIIGGARRRQSQKSQEQWAQQQSSNYEQRRSQYNRAWGACMEGKGYTVK
ncbi:MAG TPA: glycine zipper family protein [Geobacteraceae bacterium]|nr:glycine zipper family protein [Geobacteraceae bacterium]